MSSTYRPSPFGIADHPWLTKADTKFNPDRPQFKTGLTVGGPEAIAYKELVDREAKAAFDRYFTDHEEGKKLTPGERKKFSVYVPYEEELDDAGNPTGYITFKFKQNEKLKLRDGTTKTITISVVDSKNEKVTAPVFGGSEIRVMFTFRDIPMKSLKQVGVQLAFAKVQVKKLAESSGGGGGADFDEIEDGYVAGAGGQASTGTADNSEDF